MSMSSRLLEKMLKELAEDMPKRHEALQARLDNPELRKRPETSQLLRVFELFLAAPAAQGQFHPILRRTLEDTALLCEYGGPVNGMDPEAHRAWARDFLAKLRAALE